MEKEAKKFGLSSKKILGNENELTRAANEYGLGRGEDLLASIGYGKTLPRNALGKILGPEKFEKLDPEKKEDSRLETNESG